MPFLGLLRSGSLFRHDSPASKTSSLTSDSRASNTKPVRKSKSIPIFKRLDLRAPEPPGPGAERSAHERAPLLQLHFNDDYENILNRDSNYSRIKDSGYHSQDSSSSSSAGRRQFVLPSLPRFSWEDNPSQWLHDQSDQQARRDYLVEVKATASPRRLDSSSALTSLARSPEHLSLRPLRRSTLRNAMSVNDIPSQRHQRRIPQPISNSSVQSTDIRTPNMPTFQDSEASTESVNVSLGNSPQPEPRVSQHRHRVQATQGTTGGGTSLGTSGINLTGLFSNVHRTTGERPPGLSGTTTTIVGDKLFVFGGLVISRRRMSNTLYELDMKRRHWTKIEPTGDMPVARYFHTVCALGDTKLVLFGGTTGTQAGNATSHHSPRPLSDVFMYDIADKIWTEIKVRKPPTPRYAHCATILPSSAVFVSASAPLSALHHNPSSTSPNQGTLGVEIDGRGGAEMIILGGQRDEEQYCHEVDVFNFRSLSWTSSTMANLNKFGAYRSVVATVSSMPASSIGASGAADGEASSNGIEQRQRDEAGDDPSHSSVPAVLYNNYNFMDPKVEVRLRLEDGTIIDLPARGQHRPPGLRFPAAGIINHHLIVSGSFLRSSAQEYMLWALDLRTLHWHRVDIPNASLGQGSWNRGLVWNKRNAYVVLGDRTRDFQLDYVSRRTNFAHLCIIEMEALGLHDNPIKRQREHTLNVQSGEREPTPNDVVGSVAMGLREVSDMDIIVIDGERIPVNSYLLSQRWGPYFQQLMCEDLGNKLRQDSVSDRSMLQPNNTDQAGNRTSNLTITPRSRTSVLSQGSAPAWFDGAPKTDPSILSSTTAVSSLGFSASTSKPVMRSRLLFLPHTYLTARALVHYLYTLSLPTPLDPLCTPQILCSLLQIARPYRVPGLLEATVERLFEVLDGRHAAAIFNACAMAAGGGNAVRLANGISSSDDSSLGTTARARPTARNRHSDSTRRTVIDEDSDTDSSISSSNSLSSLSDASGDPEEREVWTGDWSAVIGLQKRALRGLMEGKRERELAKRDEVGDGANGVHSVGNPG